MLVCGKTLYYHAWPFRLFEVTGGVTHETYYEAFFSELTVLREVEPHRAFGPQGRELIAMLERIKTITRAEAKSLKRSGNTQKSRAGYEGTLASIRADAVAISANRYATGLSVSWTMDDYSLKHITKPAHDAIIQAAKALAVRDWIGRELFSQEYYDFLTRPWRTVIGPLHSDDTEMS